MAEYTGIALQTVDAGQNVVLTETPVCGSNCIQHREGSGIVKLRGLTNNCKARFLVSFSGNIQIPTGGTVEAISVAIAVDGEPLQSTRMIVTPAAVENFFNVSAQAYMNRSNALLTMELYANKNYGDSAIIKGDVFASRRKEVYPTGLKQFDAALGVGGIPAGNIIEIHGLENTGKTALALHIVKSFQKRNKKILYVDADRALCIEYMAMCGVTERNIYMLNMDTLEDTFQAIRTLIPVFDLIVIDTLSAIPTKEETAQTGQYLEVQNKSAKILSNEWAHIKHELARYNSTMIVINQMREKVGILWGNPLFALGGRALKAYSTISICMRYMGAEKRQGDIIGQGARADIEKNKCAAPYRSAEITILYGKGMI